MSQQNLTGWGLGISGVLVVLGMAPPAIPAELRSALIAQLVPDRSLGAESSIVTPGNAGGLPSDLIEGGAQRGALLFHSFRDFNIGEGGRVYFSNPASVQSIFTRVTGTTPSNLLGTLGVNGTASLFLLNPNGILFGPNARLDIQGSFLASSADRLMFDNGFAFSTTSPDVPPLLTISAPIGLQYGNNSGTITVQGNGHNLSYDSFTDGTVRGDVEALQVQPERTLALVGGDVILEGGNLRAEAGRIELGSVALGNVSINEQDSRLTLGYANVQSFGNIQLSQKASVDASGEGGGSIQVQSGQLSVKDGSAILSITTGASPGGDFTVNATESVELLGESADQQYASAIFTESQGTGSSGNLTINTRKLLATDGAFAAAYVTSSGNGGNLTVKASDSVEFIGRGIYRSGLFAGTSRSSSGNSGDISISTGMLSLANSAIVDANTFGQGNGRGGNISITTGTLSLTNGAIVGASTWGQGNAGNITITASDTVSFDGVGRDGFSSGAFSNVTPGAIGLGGNISITTGTLSLTNGGVVDVATFGQGNAGNITITARDAVSFDGVGSHGFPSGAYSTVETEGIGQGRTITVNTKRFSITNGAVLSTSSQGQGAAGDLEVTAQQLRLDNQGSIQAQTASGKGGNITLQVPDLLLLRQLPTDLQDTSGLIASPCAADEGNSFAITGRGGLPEDPRQPLMGDRVWLDDRATGNRVDRIPPPAPTIVEAQGWVKKSDGTIALVATHASEIAQPAVSCR